MVKKGGTDGLAKPLCAQLIARLVSSSTTCVYWFNNAAFLLKSDGKQRVLLTRGVTWQIMACRDTHRIMVEQMLNEVVRETSHSSLFLKLQCRAIGSPLPPSRIFVIF